MGKNQYYLYKEKSEYDQFSETFKYFSKDQFKCEIDFFLIFKKMFKVV